jgi:hypothetical protein
MSGYPDDQKSLSEHSFAHSANILAELAQPELILIHGERQDEVFFGCDQDWYPGNWQKRAGCGPCTAATLLYYLARRNPGLQKLYTATSHNRTDFTRFMEEIWHYVTPGSMGVNEATILTDGVRCFAATIQIHLVPAILKIPGNPQASQRLFSEMVDFIRQGLSQDCPVAFLNLSNGKLPNLDSWHWVTITGLAASDDGTILAIAADSGERKELDLRLWYCTTLLGGSLVYFTPGSESLPAASQRPG